MTEVKLNDIGEGMTEAEIMQILVEPGASVSVDEPLVEIQTDKLTAELPSPVAGVVEKIHAKVGDIVQVGNAVVTVSAAGETISEEHKTAQPSEGNSMGSRTNESAESGVNDELMPFNSKTGHVLAVPHTRKIARDLGVDIEHIQGTGPSGRVTEEDVYAFSAHPKSGVDNKTYESVRSEAGSAEPGLAESGLSQASQPESGALASSVRGIASASPAVRKLAREYGVDLADIRGSDGLGRIRAEDITAHQAGPAVTQSIVQTISAEVKSQEAKSSDAREIPFRGRRRAIAKKMSQSMFTIPHVTHFDEVDVTDIFAVKESLKKVDPEKNVSVAAFYIKALQFALQEVPIFNAKLDEENEVIRLEQEYNIGIAADTEDGLIVPVIKNVEKLSVFQIHTQMKQLIKKAKENRLTAADISDGTFTVSNVGPMGSTGATPIINYPECALMAFHKTKKTPVVRDNDEIVIRQVMNISMTFDHRVADGAKAVQFTNHFIKYIENPNLLLVDLG
ncbi:2-oxo acid dehydrogenase subunit E2 [Alicyclobacillus sp. SO9]|uniref:2-oxo acid dehydrogenase subunit E2 n=1 Tax=Alicyclobacillus sp. SO9 TaxID=2665646 RepID=UPI0018E8F07C|nr:2-oxo acid dehydrogenase subunit E2 [Alicyclobacillus sp. SO9]QQE79792.1 2-oxo acid dehydrogenase subunit E2 [Alicyclobacillus sp. SO9]